MSIFSDPGARNNDKQPISPCPENFSHLISRRMKPSVVRLIIYSTLICRGVGKLILEERLCEEVVKTKGDREKRKRASADSDEIFNCSVW
jgi:hypothetical protein